MSQAERGSGIRPEQPVHNKILGFPYLTGRWLIERFFHHAPQPEGAIYHPRQLGDENSISSQRIQIVRGLIESVQNQNLRALVVFGSVAKGTSTATSDLDYLFVKQQTTGMDGFYDEDDVELFSQLRNFSFPCNPCGIVSLQDIIADELNFSKIILMHHFFTPVELRKAGIQTLHFRDPNRSFVTDWIVLARAEQEEEEIAKLIKEAKNRELRKARGSS